MRSILLFVLLSVPLKGIAGDEPAGALPIGELMNKKLEEASKRRQEQRKQAVEEYISELERQREALRRNCPGYDEDDHFSFEYATVNFAESPSSRTAYDWPYALPRSFCALKLMTGVSGVAEIYFANALRLAPDYLSDEKLALSYVPLAVDGHWDADSINYFQRALRDVVERAPEHVVRRLSTMEREERDSALFFIFDGPHPENYQDFSKKAIDDFCLLDEAICKSAKVQWEKVQSRAKMH